MAFVTLIWAMAGYGRDPESYRAARWIAVVAVIANSFYWVLVILRIVLAAIAS